MLKKMLAPVIFLNMNRILAGELIGFIKGF
jgi:hypothetical protein